MVDHPDTHGNGMSENTTDHIEFQWLGQRTVVDRVRFHDCPSCNHAKAVTLKVDDSGVTFNGRSADLVWHLVREEYDRIRARSCFP